MKKLAELKQSETAKSPAFFFPKVPAAGLSTDMITEIKTLCEKEQKVVRICMHPDENADMHNMIIAHPKNWYVRTHASLSKTKCYHALSGRMLMIGFDSEENELFRAVLSPEDTPVLRLDKGVFLFLWALTDICIFHEIALGPFSRNTDTVFASFAPAPEEKESVCAYVEKLI